MSEKSETARNGRAGRGEVPVSTRLCLPRWGAQLCGACIAIVAVLGLLATGAQAAPPGLVSYGSFQSQQEPVGVAVDQASGNVYAAGFGAGFLGTPGPPINEFDSAGRLLSPPSPFGETFNVSAAIDAANGDLYAVGLFGSIDTYKSEGAPVESFPVLPSTANAFEYVEHPPQIAIDPSGNDLYVPNRSENDVLEYSASPPHALINTFTGGGAGALKEPDGVALDSSGNLWVADTGDNRIQKLSPKDEPIGEIRSEDVQSLALDNANGDVLAILKNKEDFCGLLESPCSHLVEYSSTGARMADIGAGTFENAGGETISSVRFPPMVAVGEASGRVYVTDGSKETVWIYGEPVAPAVDKELVSEVGMSEVKLGALVSPGGIPATYRFEYGTTSAYGSATPSPEGSVGEGVRANAVWAAASGLAPGTTYHYRVVATSELGTVDGPDQTFTTLTAEQAECPNAELRGGFSSHLPDCRAYELVTPPLDNSAHFRSGGPAAADGDAIALLTKEPTPNAPAGGDDYVVTRGPGGWSSEDMIPPHSYTSVGCNEESAVVQAYSSTMSQAVLEVGTSTSVASESDSAQCNAEGVEVAPGEPLGYENLVLREGLGNYKLINSFAEAPKDALPANAQFKRASADLSHVVFSERAPLTQGAPYGVEDLYEWDQGVLRLLSVLPDGTPVGGTLPEPVSEANPMSVDGSHVVFAANGDLFVRIDGQRTVEVDEAQTGSGVSGGGVFQTASADGSKVFFLDEGRLTADSAAESGEPDLYECVLPEGADRCELSDLTVAGGGEHADVAGVSALGRADSSHLYFIARGVLASNTRTYTDDEGSQIVERAEKGQPNLYLLDGAKTVFIATLGSGEGLAVGQASPDGMWLSLSSTKSLTGYDNALAQGHSSAREIFLYSAASGRLVCASCNPSGEAPTADVAESGGLGGGVQRRAVSDGGRLVFDTREALVPSDTNGLEDVYEYEGGNVYLISSGTSRTASSFLDASENGDDVFFLTTQALVSQDTQEEADVVYDARVDGGFPATVSPSICTTADACRIPVSPQPSIYGVPSSQTFSGVGNLASSPAPAPKPSGQTKPKSKQKNGCQPARSKPKRRACKAKNKKGKHGQRQVKSRRRGR